MRCHGAFSGTKLLVLTVGTALAVSATATAWAQTDYTQLQPPARAAPDANGVDLISGQLIVPAEGVEIGMRGQSGIIYALNVQLTQLDPTQIVRINMFDSLKGVIANIQSNSQQGFYIKFQLNIGGKTESFGYSDLVGNNPIPLQKSGSSLVLTTNPAGYQYTDTDGSLLVYVPSPYIANNYYNDPFQSKTSGLIKSLLKPDGERLTYYYKIVPIMAGTKALTTSVLNAVVSSAGWMIKYGYSSTTHAQTSVMAINLSVDYCDPNADSCGSLSRPWPMIGFQDTGTGFTESDALGQVTSYTRAGNQYGPMSSFTISSPSGLARVANMQVVQVHNPSGGGYLPDAPVYAMIVNSARKGNSVWNYSYTWGAAPSSSPQTNSNLGFTNVIHATKIQDPVGNARNVYTDFGDPEASVYVPNGYYFPLSYVDIGSDADALNRSTIYNHDPFGSITSVIFPEGNYVDGSGSANYTYDDRGNVTALKRVPKAGSGLAALIETAGYDATCANAVTCNKPNYVVDAKGNRADFTYDPVHGGILTQTGAADADGVRPQTRYAYAQLTPQMKNAAGTLVNSTPI